MDRLEYVLAVLSPAAGATYTPVQLQKLFFLMDREAQHLVDGPYYEFQPYDYGPFDGTVYDDLKALAENGKIERIHNGRWTNYRLSEAGQVEAEQYFDKLEPDAKSYIMRASEFVRSLSFSDLVRSIYKAYPDMKVNSVFNG
jgi:uncharacterized protein YwgA